MDYSAYVNWVILGIVLEKKLLVQVKTKFIYTRTITLNTEYHEYRFMNKINDINMDLFVFSSTLGSSPWSCQSIEVIVKLDKLASEPFNPGEHWWCDLQRSSSLQVFGNEQNVRTSNLI